MPGLTHSAGQFLCLKDHSMRRHILAAAALLAASLPASAETWGVNDVPSQAPTGQWSCMLWYGEGPPMMNITLMSDRNFITVAAPQFAAVADGAEGRIAYASGRGGTIALRKAADRPEAVFVFFPDEMVDAILDQFRAQGTFSLTSDEASASFPVPGLGSGIEILKTCVDAFPAEAE
ncbi:hypothetical protein HNE_0612 [Hyphomonas neptunium ATCC 15444]|uniref:Invasion associated locus B family protein n=2 Tax=Hyphomonas TaxID=85 RepID=Q0C4K2_HYPNA|nr:hypothetical protein HNE_0612 [Hyphomonas neptunium ATCC 15444]